MCDRTCTWGLFIIQPALCPALATACLASGGGGAAPSSDPPPPPVDLPTLSPSKTSGVGDPRRPLLPELRRDALEKRRTGYAAAALLRCAAKTPPLISVRPGRHPVHPWSLLRSKVFCPLVVVVVVVRGQSKARKPLLRHADEEYARALMGMMITSVRCRRCTDRIRAPASRHTRTHLLGASWPHVTVLHSSAVL
ncbi:hypothetical protein PVAP13_1KG257205 [Panicum virgatum]|uniref:Secreted protein n=1 Tax=Panicum virgatum TaxID=38727 RepID=A0A8T0XKI3_PANVG|nr:hypothetical protein PVAP13_1KG257205 [Panicum virgatum]